MSNKNGSIAGYSIGHTVDICLRLPCIETVLLMFPFLSAVIY